jgi:hypothetical protein
MRRLPAVDPVAQSLPESRREAVIESLDCGTFQLPYDQGIRIDVISDE